MSKILLGIKDLKDIEKYPVDGYVLGYEKYTLFAPNRFSYEEIKSLKNKDNIYILLNALIHQDNLQDFKLEVQKLIELKVRFIIQDMGAFAAISGLVSPSHIIFNPYTLISNTNDFITYKVLTKAGIGISNQLDINEIISLSKNKNAFLMIYGYEPIYQSFRKVLSLYQEAINLHLINEQLYLKEDTREDLYPVIENEYGSVIFNYRKVNLLDHINELNECEYFYVDSFLTSDEEIDDVIRRLK